MPRWTITLVMDSGRTGNSPMRSSSSGLARRAMLIGLSASMAGVRGVLRRSATRTAPPVGAPAPVGPHGGLEPIGDAGAQRRRRFRRIQKIRRDGENRRVIEFGCDKGHRLVEKAMRLVFGGPASYEPELLKRSEDDGQPLPVPIRVSRVERPQVCPLNFFRASVT